MLRRQASLRRGRAAPLLDALARSTPEARPFAPAMTATDGADIAAAWVAEQLARLLSTLGRLTRTGER